jgi:hypothetical protein
LTWTAFGDLSGVTVELYADTGSGYVAVSTGIDPALGILNFDVSGQSGFTSLDSTDFRAQLLQGGLDLEGSPQFLTPTYACV